MARINVEDTIWSDSRFLKLCIKMKDELRATGAIIIAWKTAQKYWCPDRKPIPKEVFASASLPLELVEVGLAEEIDGGIRMRGAEEHFAWWFQKQEAGRKGGLASARVRSSTTQRIEPSSSSSSSSSKDININIPAGEKAKRVMDAIRTVPRGEPDRLKRLVGENLFQEVLERGGWEQFRTIKRDQFTMMNAQRVFQ